MIKKGVWILPILIACLGFPKVNLAQDVDFVWKPDVNYSWKQTDKLSFNAKNGVFYSLNNINNNSGVKFIEAALTASYTTSTTTKIGGGYVYWWRSPFLVGYQYEHRIVEQVSFSSYWGDKKLGHQIKLEQRIRENSYFNRIRYRVSHEFPIFTSNGDSYIKINDEYLLAFNALETDGENRALIAFGKELTDKREFEIGFQYRTRDMFLDSGITHLFLFSTVFSISR